jgi:hypothetical protein
MAVKGFKSSIILCEILTSVIVKFSFVSFRHEHRNVPT